MAKAKDPMEQLSQMLQEAAEKYNEREEIKMSEPDQMKFIKEFLANPTSYKVGTRLVRNKFGLARYRYPTGGQVALLAEVLDVSIADREHMPTNATLAIVSETSEGNTVSIHNVDLRYYQKA